MSSRWLGWLGILSLAATVVGSSRGDSPAVQRIQGLIAGLDEDEARRELAAQDPGDPAFAIERARLAIYELDCDGAAATLGRPELQRASTGEALADIARGCQRVTAALVTDKDDARGIEVRWQDEHDRALAPLLFETVAKSRLTLTRDLGVDWPRPTRIVVVRDLLSLSAMTGLPYKSAQTTGTVAVAKWGRVTLLSPRASPQGYPWRDTIAHELTHLAVTRASRDQAPLWLQEGIAKREEVRWRNPGPFDDRPPPEALVQRGMELKLALPLDKLGPSIAMLPSADQAMVAFAEVTSFVRFYADAQGEGALPTLMAEFRSGKAANEALLAASGADLSGWDVKWRAYLASRPRESLPSLLGLGRGHEGLAALRELRDRSRLAELLLSRQHPGEALPELDAASDAEASSSPRAERGKRFRGDPSLRWLRARALEELGKRELGEALVSDPNDVLTPYGPWWAIRGRWARLRGDEAEASASFVEAVAADPFDPEAACETLDARAEPRGASRDSSLCESARATGQPPFGPD